MLRTIDNHEVSPDRESQSQAVVRRQWSPVSQITLGINEFLSNSIEITYKDRQRASTRSSGTEMDFGCKVGYFFNSSVLLCLCVVKLFDIPGICKGDRHGRRIDRRKMDRPTAERSLGQDSVSVDFPISFAPRMRLVARFIPGPGNWAIRCCTTGRSKLHYRYESLESVVSAESYLAKWTSRRFSLIRLIFARVITSLRNFLLVLSFPFFSSVIVTVRRFPWEMVSFHGCRTLTFHQEFGSHMAGFNRDENLCSSF